MNKITVSVSVSIYGDDFDLNKVIKRFNVLSTETRVKGVIPKRSQRKCSNKLDKKYWIVFARY